MTLPTNPKAKFGAQKPNLALIPGSANVAEALALEDGAQKYGAFNWRESQVEIMTYVAAIRRHLDAYVDGDANTADTNVPNLGAIRACCSILIDAEASGTLIDNRPKATSASARMQDAVKASRQMLGALAHEPAPASEPSHEPFITTHDFNDGNGPVPAHKHFNAVSGDLEAAVAK
jgi:hypothetical protein